MSEIIIEKAGLLSTIQDCGRVGYQRFGMPISGAMDVYSLKFANIIVGNEPGAAAIEATLIGPEIFFPADTVFSVCGSGMTPSVNGNAVPMYVAISAKRGDKLTFSALGYGCRAYIAFAGGLDVPLIMGSRSTYLRAKIGGLNGRALVAGDRIPLGTTDTYGISGIIARQQSQPQFHIPEYQSEQPIRIIPGPEVKRLGFDGIRTLLTSEFQITGQSDRMGIRLSGPTIQIKTGAGGHDIISAGISPGTIQLPGNGQPIILMADRQTTGGYARIANVASIDLTRVAQLRPGDKIRFQEISIKKAQEELKKNSIFVLSTVPL
ncbi:MAG: biotin-dependent carboxyltransferase family protein [Bacteroidales bacterium]|jgi:antagonist of KipI